MDILEFLTRIFGALHSIEKIITGLGVIAAAIGVAFVRLYAHYQGRRLTSEEESHRESHNLNLFKALASSNSRLRLAAAAVLVERLMRLRQKEEREGELSAFEQSEKVSIIRALVSVTKSSGDKEAEPSTAGAGSRVDPVGLGKYVADSAAKVLNAGDVSVQSPRPVTTKSVMLRPKGPSPLQDYDWQRASLRYAWWPSIDARSVDFFKADLSDSGMKFGRFHEAQLKEAVLQRVQLREADLKGANLTSADLDGANFNGADLCGANLSDIKNFATASFINARYDGKTTFPDDPSWDNHRAKMICVESGS